MIAIHPRFCVPFPPTESHTTALIVKAGNALPANNDLKQDSLQRSGSAPETSTTHRSSNRAVIPVKSRKAPEPKTTDPALRRLLSGNHSGKATQNCGKPQLFSTAPSNIRHAYASKSHETQARQRCLSMPFPLNCFRFETQWPLAVVLFDAGSWVQGGDRRGGRGGAHGHGCDGHAHGNGRDGGQRRQESGCRRAGKPPCIRVRRGRKLL